VTNRELDLPLEDTPSSRFLVWIIAGLTYLTVLALAVAAVADGTLRMIELRPKIVTVALPPAVTSEAEDGEMRVALELLRNDEGVARASPVASDELERLVESWLVDDGAAGGRLELPRLIDVTFRPSAEPDVAALEQRLRAVVAGASIEIDELPVDRSDDLARLLRAGGGLVGLALLVGTLVVVVVVTRMSLDLHDDTVDLLRLMGAPDGYVARQFELHALLHGLRGGLIGFAAALATVLAAVHAAELLERLSPLPIELRPVDWVLLACVPVVAAMLITATARLTALRSLSRMRWPRAVGT
jgi:cell division transport system permease protein